MIGVDFAEPRYRKGGTIIWVADNELGCTTGLTYAAAEMPSGWNDATSSAIALGGCDTVTHYKLARVRRTAHRMYLRCHGSDARPQPAARRSPAMP